MSCDSPPLTPFQPARRRHTEIESIMGKRTYTALSMYIERRGTCERGRQIGAGERTFIDSIMDVKRRRWVGTHTRGIDDRGEGVGGGRGCATQLG